MKRNVQLWTSTQGHTRVFGLLSASLLLFPQRFGRYVLRPSSGVCRTWKPSRNFELRPSLNPQGSHVLVPLAITVDSMKDVVRSSVKVLEYDKHLKKAGGRIGRNAVEITIKMKTIVRKPLMEKNLQTSSQKFRQLITFISYVWTLDSRDGQRNSCCRLALMMIRIIQSRESPRAVIVKVFYCGLEVSELGLCF